MRCASALLLVAVVAVAYADGPLDNLVDKVRPVPPPGIAVPEADRKELQAGVEQLGKEIAALRKSLSAQPVLLALLPDVQIYHNAVRYALTYNEFYNPREFGVARALLKQGMERAQLLRDGRAPWATASGLVARGYVSRIDGSVQPYGLVVPASYQPGSPYRHRLDCWFHGRGEKLTELSFLNDRQRNPGQFTPPHAFVLHLYGRYCNANKFAGEVDCFEALEHVRQSYPIDENRIVARGFSMGGAACWQFGVHYAGQWAAIAPGAGFSETPDFLKVFQNETLKPTWYEKKLWHLYDATDYALNLFNCPTVAYSGAIDRQKQAADRMAEAMAAEGMTLEHVIGPKTGHSYHPQAKEEINRRIDSIVAKGRNPVPERVRFTTWTLRYNQMLWVTVDGLEKHWEQARVDALMHPEYLRILEAERPWAKGPPSQFPAYIKVSTQNVSALTLTMAPGYCPFTITRKPKVSFTSYPTDANTAVRLNGTVEASPVLSDRSWTAHFRKEGETWKLVDSADDGTLRKRHGLQGPIDDAFMDRFLMVRPTGRPLSEKVGAWVTREQVHALDHWRRQFRGEAPVKDDDAVTEADIASSNLILWGDPSSNSVLAKIADRLPIRWQEGNVQVGKATFPLDHHIPVLIYPNPLNPKRYVVLNSGFTFREYDYLNNARQTPKLPDYAVLDINVPATSRTPAGIVTAGFFGERWELLAPEQKQGAKE